MKFIFSVSFLILSFFNHPLGAQDSQTKFQQISNDALEKEIAQEILEYVKTTSWYKPDGDYIDYLFSAVIRAYIHEFKASFKDIDIKDEQDFKNKVKPYVESGFSSWTLASVRSMLTEQSQKLQQILFFLPDEENGGRQLELLALPLVFVHTPMEEQFIQAVIAYIQEKAPQELIINMKDNSTEFVLALAELVKKNEMDIYILGHCAGPCSIYLLPAASKITIGPYGLITYSNFIPSLHKKISTAFKRSQKLFKDFLKREGGIIEHTKKLVTDFRLVNHRETAFNSVAFEERYKPLKEHLNIILADADKEYLDKNLVDQFLNTEENKKLWFEVLYQLHPDFSRWSYKQREDFENKLLYESQKTQEFFQTFTPQSQLPYSFVDFLEYMDSLSIFGFQELYPNYKEEYFELKDLKPSVVIPSEELLKKLGLPIVRGVNKLSNQFNESKEHALHIDAEKIEKCQFMSESPNQEVLSRCLSKNKEKPDHS